MNILIVDDRPSNLGLLRAQMEGEGHAVREALDGIEALAILDEGGMDAIISDILMPRMDGYRLCDEVHKSERWHRIPFIFYTATYMSPADEQLCFRLGADKYLRKPVAAQTLLTALHEAVNSTVPRILNRMGSLIDSEVMKEYSERLVSKLEEKNVELGHANETTHAQLARLELLGEITRAIGAHQDLHTIFRVVATRLESDLPVDFSCVCLYDAAENSITVDSVGERGAVLAADLALHERPGFVDPAGLSRGVLDQLVYEPDLSEVQLPFLQRLARGGLRSLVMAPLRVEGKVLGMLVTARRAAQGFNNPECEFLRQLSEHVALAAHQARLYGALQEAYEDLGRSQQAVMQQERLRALGQMASGVAHDINNAISPVVLYSDTLLEYEPDLSERTRKYLTSIQRSMIDVTRTVGRMREFARPQEVDQVLTAINVNRMVQQVVELATVRLHSQPQEHGVVINVHTELMPDLPKVVGAENELRDALTNLIFNAVDAMPTGGTLTLRTRVVPIQSADSSETVQVEVQDTGIGMDEPTRRRCLEPFFTTKGERGTGLGLAMVYGMAQRHGAEVDLDSTPGKGTTVRLSFPTTATMLESTQSIPALRPIRALRILIVDDDPLIIESLRDTLQNDGHCVTAMAGGQAGIDAFLATQSGDEQFAVVITDLGMPYIDGRKVAAAVKAVSPLTPVIMLTGWGQRLKAENEVPPYVDRVINKPAKLLEIRRVLAEIAGSQSTA